MLVLNIEIGSKVIVKPPGEQSPQEGKVIEIHSENGFIVVELDNGKAFAFENVQDTTLNSGYCLSTKLNRILYGIDDGRKFSKGESPTAMIRLVFGEIAKIVTMWELDFRLLTQNLKLDAYSVIEKEEYDLFHSNKLHKVLERLEEKYPSLKGKFNEVKNIRDAVSHANFLEITDIAHKHSNKELYNEVVVGNFSDPEASPLFIGTHLKKGELIKVGIFGLYLRSINLDIAKIIISLVLDSIEMINDLQEFRSLTTKNNLFEKVFKDNMRLDENDILSFFNEWSFKYSSKDDVEIFFKKITSYLD